MNYKIKILIISLIIFLFLLSSFILNYTSSKKTEAQEIVKENKLTTKEEVKTEKKIKKIKIDIKGYVNNPGVYELEESSRVIDAINLAGGLKEEADSSILNLSKKLDDEMVIIVYSVNEIKEYKDKLKSMNEINQEKTKEIICPDNSNKACISQNDNNKNKTQKEENTLVNINTATKEELMQINGIGEGKAESIVTYREENGLFNIPEDIKNVSGIGDSLYEKIKEYITT